MRIPEHPTRIRSMRDARVRQLSAHTPVLAGSLVRIAKHCGRAGCHCQSGDKHVGWYLTQCCPGLEFGRGAWIVACVGGARWD